VEPIDRATNSTHAVGIDEGDRVGLRQVLQPTGQKLVRILVRHLSAEFFRRLRSKLGYVRLDLLEDEIDRLDATRCLFGQHNAEVCHSALRSW
jgi:hypothetical protein